MTPDQRDVHGQHEDERNRDRRERRATARAIADERLLNGRRLDALLAFDPSIIGAEDDTGFAPGGCV